MAWLDNLEGYLGRSPDGQGQQHHNPEAGRQFLGSLGASLLRNSGGSPNGTLSLGQAIGQAMPGANQAAQNSRDQQYKDQIRQYQLNQYQHAQDQYDRANQLRQSILGRDPSMQRNAFTDPNQSDQQVQAFFQPGQQGSADNLPADQRAALAGMSDDQLQRWAGDHSGVNQTVSTLTDDQKRAMGLDPHNFVQQNSATGQLSVGSDPYASEQRRYQQEQSQAQQRFAQQRALQNERLRGQLGLTQMRLAAQNGVPAAGDATGATDVSGNPTQQPTDASHVADAFGYLNRASAAAGGGLSELEGVPGLDWLARRGAHIGADARQGQAELANISTTGAHLITGNNGRLTDQQQRRMDALFPTSSDSRVTALSKLNVLKNSTLPDAISTAQQDYQSATTKGARTKAAQRINGIRQLQSQVMAASRSFNTAQDPGQALRSGIYGNDSSQSQGAQLTRPSHIPQSAWEQATPEQKQMLYNRFNR